MTIYGYDVSQDNASIVLDRPTDFIIGKSTEGTHTADSLYIQHRNFASQHGLRFGAYHFGHPEENSIAQESAFFVHMSTGAEFYALDLEPEGSNWTGLSSADITAYKNEFLRNVKMMEPTAQVGLYCDQDTWTKVIQDNLYGDFLWIAAPSGLVIHTTPTFIQTGTGPNGLDEDTGLFLDRASLDAWLDGAGMEADMSVTVISNNLPAGRSCVPLPPPNGGALRYQNVFLSLFADWAPATVRVAIGDGNRWDIKPVTINPGQRILVPPFPLTAETLGVSFEWEPNTGSDGKPGVVGYMIELEALGS